MATARIPPEHPPGRVSSTRVFANHPSTSSVLAAPQAFFTPSRLTRKEWLDLIGRYATPEGRRSIEDVICRANTRKLTSLLRELPTKFLSIRSTRRAITVVNKNRSLPRQHIVRVDAADAQVVRALLLLVVTYSDDLDSTLVRRPQFGSWFDVAGIDPPLLVYGPEGVRIGGHDGAAAVVGLDGEVGELLVILGEDGVEDLFGSRLSGVGVSRD